MGTVRYFEHNLSDEAYSLPREACFSGIAAITARLLGVQHSDDSVYTGVTGVNYALLRLVANRAIQFPLQTDPPVEWDYLWDTLLRIARSTLHSVSRVSPRRKGWSLFFGHAGIYATSAMVFDQAVKEEGSQNGTSHQLMEERDVVLQKLFELAKLVSPFIAESVTGPEDEVLYGRAGYLLSLLSIQSMTQLPSDLVLDVIRALIDSGRYQSQKQHHPSPLYYEWPTRHRSKPYLGAAHGFMGILYTMLHFVEHLEALGELQTVLQCIHYVMDRECDEQGNPGSHGFFPSSLGSSHLPLIHWCHGSPGAVFLFSKAYEVFQQDSFLHAAIRAGEVVWQRGLLKKGPGLCHGVSGNGFALLKLYKLTNEEKYLTRACRFAEFMLSPAFNLANVPDHPWSLYEGWAGALCFLVDLLDPKTARFPLFEF